MAEEKNGRGSFGCPIPGMQIVQDLEKHGAPIPNMQPVTPSQPQPVTQPQQPAPQSGSSGQGSTGSAERGDKK